MVTFSQKKNILGYIHCMLMQAKPGHANRCTLVASLRYF